MPPVPARAALMGARPGAEAFIIFLNRYPMNAAREAAAPPGIGSSAYLRSSVATRTIELGSPQACAVPVAMHGLLRNLSGQALINEGFVSPA
jgi:hypothetical protein